jgi:putative DNA primase/helicase
MIDSLMVKPGGESANTLTDLADLRGARFVGTSETEYGQRLSEGRLKRITQGMGTIKAVRKYENPIVFPETHKLWIDANHLPVISGSENAIWNRLHAIPFTVTIPPEEIDRQLPVKLLAEAEGVLAWCVAGAKRWYAEGLGKPAAVADAVDGWRDDMNTLGPFLEEMCELRPDDSEAWVKVSEMWKAYTDWAERNDEKRPLSRQALAAQLESRGVVAGKRDEGRTRVWRGIRFCNRVRTTGQAGT